MAHLFLVTPIHTLRQAPQQYKNISKMLRPACETSPRGNPIKRGMLGLEPISKNNTEDFIAISSAR